MNSTNRKMECRFRLKKECDHPDLTEKSEETLPTLEMCNLCILAEIAENLRKA